MINYLRGTLFVALLFINACSAPRSNPASPRLACRFTSEREAAVIYKTIFNRENFFPPRRFSDYEIDYAMRMGVLPRLDEPSGMPSGFYFLQGKMNMILANMEKTNPRSTGKLIKKWISEIGLNWWLVAHRATLDAEVKEIVENALQDPSCKKSTYCRLSLIKEDRIRNGKWHP